MFCPNCGAQIAEDSKFCGECGTVVSGDDLNVGKKPVFKEQAQVHQFAQENNKKVKKVKIKKEKRKVSKVKIVLILLLVIILGTIGGAGYWYFTSSVLDITKSLKSEDYEEVVDIYNDECVENVLEKLVADYMLNECVSECVSAFNSGEMEYETAYEILSVFSEIENDELASQAKESLEIIVENYENSLLVAEAEDELELGDYLSAIETYEQISTDAEGYEDIETKILEAKEAYKISILEQTKLAEAEADYVAYISLVTTALSMMPEDEELLARKSELESSYTELVKEDTLERVGEMVKNLEYESALKLLNEKLSSLGEDTDLVNLLTSTKEMYIEYIVSEVDELIEEKKFDEAISLLEESLDVVPDETSFAELQAEITDMKPIKLSTLTITEQSGISIIESGSTLTDTIGNVYYGPNLYKISDNGHFTLYLGGAYDTLTFDIAVRDSSSSNTVDFSIVDEDGTLLYNKDTMGLTTIVDSVEVDISGAEWLTVQVSSCSYTTDIIFADPLLYK